MPFFVLIYLFQVFPKVVKVWKTVNKFLPNWISLLINEIETLFFVNKENLLLKLKHEYKYCVIIY